MISTVLFAAISIVQSLLSNGIDQNTLHPQKDTLTAIASGHRFVHSLGYVTNGLIHFYDAVYYDRNEYNNWYAIDTNTTEDIDSFTTIPITQWHDLIGGNDLILSFDYRSPPERLYHYSSISNSSGTKYKTRDWASIKIITDTSFNSILTTKDNIDLSGKCSEYTYQFDSVQPSASPIVQYEKIFAIIAETKRYYRKFLNIGVHRGLLFSTCAPVRNTKDGYSASGFVFNAPIIATSLSPFRQSITTDGNISNTNSYLRASVCPMSFSYPDGSVIPPVYTCNTNGTINYSNIKTIYLRDEYIYSATTNITNSGNIGLVEQYISKNYSIYAFDGGWNNTFSEYSRFLDSDFFNNTIESDYEDIIIQIPESAMLNIPESEYSADTPSSGDIVLKPGLHIGGIPLMVLGSGSTVDEMYNNATYYDEGYPGSQSLVLFNPPVSPINNALIPQINCIRIYNRELTEAEKEQNRSVDEARFGFKIWNYRVNEQ